MGFLSVMLWPLFYPPGTTLAGGVMAVPFLAGFLRDWLVVSGRLDPDSSGYQAVRARLKAVGQGWLPVGLRLGVTLGAVWFLWPIGLDPGLRRGLLAWPGSPLPAITADLLGILAVITPIMLALGVLARLAALGLMAPIAMTILASGLHLPNGLLLGGSLAIMLLGGGYYTLSGRFGQLDEIFVRRQAGSGSKR
jgi:CDP-diacylglycerol--glycerol-3-phosphate 3-phosphatidyltransferase